MSLGAKRGVEFLMITGDDQMLCKFVFVSNSRTKGEVARELGWRIGNFEEEFEAVFAFGGLDGIV